MRLTAKRKKWLRDLACGAIGWDETLVRADESGHILLKFPVEEGDKVAHTVTDLHDELGWTYPEISDFLWENPYQVFISRGSKRRGTRISRARTKNELAVALGLTTKQLDEAVETYRRLQNVQTGQ